MGSGFAWLNEFMVWIGRLFPRLVLVKANEGEATVTEADIECRQDGHVVRWLEEN